MKNYSKFLFLVVATMTVAIRANAQQSVVPTKVTASQTMVIPLKLVEATSGTYQANAEADVIVQAISTIAGVQYVEIKRAKSAVPMVMQYQVGSKSINLSFDGQNAMVFPIRYGLFGNNVDKKGLTRFMIKAKHFKGTDLGTTRNAVKHSPTNDGKIVTTKQDTVLEHFIFEVDTINKTANCYIVINQTSDTVAVVASDELKSTVDQLKQELQKQLEQQHNAPGSDPSNPQPQNPENPLPLEQGPK